MRALLKGHPMVTLTRMQKERRGVAVVIKRVLFSYLPPDVGASYAEKEKRGCCSH